MGSKFQNSVFLSKFDRKSSKVNQVIYSSAQISIPNMKAVAQIHFQISCTQDFQILLSRGHNSKLVKHYVPNCMLVPKLAVCRPMIHLLHLNEVKFNFLKKLFFCLCFVLDPETECNLFAAKLKME